MRASLPVLLLALATPAAGGTFAKELMLRQRTYGPAGPASAEEQRQYFSGDKIVVDDGRARSIVDLVARTWTLVDKRKKNYTVMPFDDLRRRGEAATKALERLPPEARRMLGLDVAVSVRPTGRTERIAGHTAKEYAIAAGPARGTVWVTEEIRLPAEAQEWEKLSASLGGPARPGGSLEAEIAKLAGLPLRTSMTVSLGPGKVETTTEVVEVREAPAPPEMLRIPEGFEKIAPPKEE
jgi:hypothetical protein